MARKPRKTINASVAAGSGNRLEQMRKALQAQAPAMQFQPVQDVGQGISQAANNLAQMMAYRRNQQLMMDMYNKEMAAKKKLYMDMGLPEAQADAAALDDQMGRQLQEQYYKTQAGQQKEEADQKIWQSYYDAYIANATGGTRQPSLPEIANAQIAANSAIFGQRSPIGGDAVGNSIGAGIRSRSVEDAIPSVTLPNDESIPVQLRGKTLPGGLGKFNYVQATPEERMVLQNLGITEPEDLLTTTDRRSASRINATNARFIGPEKQEGLTGVRLGNTGKGIQNRRDQIGLNTEQTVYDMQRGVLGGKISLPGFLYQSAVMGDNPGQAFSLYGGENFGKDGNKIFEGFDFGGYVQPPSPYVGTGASGVMQEAKNRQTQSMLAPAQQGEADRQRLMQLPQTISNDAQNFSLNAGGWLQNTLQGAIDYGRGFSGVKPESLAPIPPVQSPLLGGENASIGAAQPRQQFRLLPMMGGGF